MEPVASRVPSVLNATQLIFCVLQGCAQGPGKPMAAFPCSTSGVSAAGLTGKATAFEGRAARSSMPPRCASPHCTPDTSQPRHTVCAKLVWPSHHTSPSVQWRKCVPRRLLPRRSRGGVLRRRRPCQSWAVRSRPRRLSGASVRSAPGALLVRALPPSRSLRSMSWAASSSCHHTALTAGAGPGGNWGACPSALAVGGASSCSSAHSRRQAAVVSWAERWRRWASHSSVRNCRASAFRARVGNNARHWASDQSPWRTRRRPSRMKRAKKYSP